MNVASWIWVLIPLAAILAGVVKRWLDVKEREVEALRAQRDIDAQRHAEHTRALEERVRVLERIATDKGVTLADEIERLRDQR